MASIANLVVHAGLDTRGIASGVHRAQKQLLGFVNAVSRASLKAQFFPVSTIQNDLNRAANVGVDILRRRFNAKQTKIFEKLWDGKISDFEAGVMFDNAKRTLLRGTAQLRSIFRKNNWFGAGAQEQTRVINKMKNEVQGYSKVAQKEFKSVQAASKIVQQATSAYRKEKLSIKDKVQQRLLTPEQAHIAGLRAIEAHDNALRQGMKALQRKGLLTDAVRDKIVSQFRGAGITAGQAAGEAARREFLRKWRTIGYAAVSIGRDLTFALTLPMLAIGGVGVRVMHDFEFSMNRVRGYTGATLVEMKALTEQARQLGRDTQFTAAQVGDAFVEMSKAGFNVNEQMAVMNDTLKLAASSNLDMATAADIASSILQGYSLPVSDFSNAVNMMVRTFTSAKVDITDLGVSFRYVGAIAENVGMEFSETSAVLAMLAKAGIRGSMAGTALRGVLIRLLAPSKKAAGIMEDYGIKITDSEKKMLPFIQILEQFKRAGLNAGEIGTIFGQRAGPAMAVLIEKGTVALAELQTKIENHGNIADRVAEAMMSGLRGAWLLFKSNAEDLAIALGDAGLRGALTELLNNLAAFMRMIGSAPQPVKLLILALGGLLTVIGPLVWIAGRLTQAFLLMKQANLAFLAGLGLPQLAAAVVLLGGMWLMLRRIGRQQREIADDGKNFSKVVIANNLEQLKSLQAIQKAKYEGLAAEKRRLDQLRNNPANAIEQFGGVTVSPLTSEETARLAELDTELKKYQNRLELIKEQIDALTLAEAENIHMTDELRELLAELAASMDNMDFGGEGSGDPIADMIKALEEARERAEYLEYAGLDTSKAFGSVLRQMESIQGIVDRVGPLKVDVRLLNALKETIEWLKEKGAVKRELDLRVAEITAALSSGNQQIFDAALDGLFQIEADMQNKLDDAMRTIQAGGNVTEEYLTTINEALEGARDAIAKAVQEAADRGWRQMYVDTSGDDEGPLNSNVFKRLQDRLQEFANRIIDLKDEWTDATVIAGQAGEIIAEKLLAIAEKIPTPGEVIGNVTAGGAEFFLGMVSSFGYALGSTVVALADFMNPLNAVKVLFEGIKTLGPGLVNALNPLKFYSDVFAQILQALTPVLEPLTPIFEELGAILANTIAPVFEALAPVLRAFYPVLYAILQILTPILKAFIPVLEALVPIFEALFPILKQAAIAFTYVAQVAFNLAGGLLKVLGWILEGVGKFLAAIAKLVNKIVPFADPLKGMERLGNQVARTGQAMQDAGDKMFQAAGEMARARDEIKQVDIGKLEPPIDRVADQFNRLANLNVPEVFKLKLREFEAIAGEGIDQIPSSYRFEKPNTGTGAQVIDQSMNFSTGSVVIQGANKSANELLQELKNEARKEALNRTGTTAGTDRLF